MREEKDIPDNLIFTSTIQRVLGALPRVTRLLCCTDLTRRVVVSYSGSGGTQVAVVFGTVQPLPFANSNTKQNKASLHFCNGGLPFSFPIPSLLLAARISDYHLRATALRRLLGDRSLVVHKGELGRDSDTTPTAERRQRSHRQFLYGSRLLIHPRTNPWRVPWGRFVSRRRAR